MARPKQKTTGKRRSFWFDADFDEMLAAQTAASGATMTETLRRALRIRERIRLAAQPSREHPRGEYLAFVDNATGAVRRIDWL